MATTFTPQKLQDQVYREVSGAIPGGPSADPDRVLLLAALQQQLPEMWDYAGIDASPFAGTGWFVLLQKQYCKLAALELLEAQLSPNVDQMLGRVFRSSSSQLVKNIQALRDFTYKRILGLEKKAQRNIEPSVGQLIQTAPVMRGQVPPTPGPGEPAPPASIYPDANDPYFAGTPYNFGPLGEGPY